MDEFETINLDSKECKICKQDTGEELISCILRDKFAAEEKSISSSSAGSNERERETSFAHRVCLERWDTVMKNTFFRQPKKTWKDRLKGFITTGSANNSETETWTPVILGNVEHSDANDNRPIFEPTKREKEIYSGTTGYSVFRTSKEAYRVENVGDGDSEHDQWRTNKVRICSVDSDEEAEEHAGVIRFTREKLQECDVVQLIKFAENLQLQINNVSSDLVMHLQERDGLLLQKHTMKVTVGQLVHLQSKIKTSSTQNIPRSTTSTASGNQNVIIT